MIGQRDNSPAVRNPRPTALWKGVLSARKRMETARGNTARERAEGEAQDLMRKFQFAKAMEEGRSIDKTTEARRSSNTTQYRCVIIDDLPQEEQIRRTEAAYDWQQERRNNRNWQ